MPPPLGRRATPSAMVATGHVEVPLHAPQRARSHPPGFVVTTGRSDCARASTQRLKTKRQLRRNVGFMMAEEEWKRRS